MDTVIERVRMAYPVDLWWLGAGCFLNIAGLSLLWPVNALYIHTTLGKPMTVAGMVLMLYSAMGFFGSLFAGWLYDRIGPLRVFVIGLLPAALVICLPGLFQAWTPYIGVMAVFGFACAMPFPAFNALAGQVWPEGGRRAFNFIYVANNLGVALGTAVGGFLAEVSFRCVFFGIAAAYAGLLILVTVGFRRRFSSTRRRKAGLVGKGKLGASPNSLLSAGPTGLPWGPVFALLLGFVSAWAIYVQWQSTISVYMQSLGFPLSAYSLLWTLNGLVIFAGQPLVSLVTKRIHTLSVQMWLGCGLFAACFLLLAFYHGYPAFVTAMVLLTFGEMFVWPAVPAALASMAPDDKAGLVQGLSGACATLGRMIGPVVGGVMYDRMAMSEVLLVCAVGFALPFVSFSLFHKLAHRDKTPVSQNSLSG
ncbi:MAG: MFS transporter [Alicyclobacillus herbarius]|uniref:MDR family MFS transporter n=1 Tax=Alicyclobacillus herbarius TaxID=122960 RepID=UPI002352B40F|nr:MFS transporter [Alicyclobacillus herbarius]MCL6631877.1 MFS transporter [Alicyclobacillus herbarius]